MSELDTSQDPTSPGADSRAQDDSGVTPGDGHRLAQQAAEQASEANEAADTAGTGGEVSQVARMDPADVDTPISDSQSVAGQPDGESGDVQEGAQGPNANPHQGYDTH